MREFLNDIRVADDMAHLVEDFSVSYHSLSQMHVAMSNTVAYR
jgi:hypothetical protein